MFETCKSSIEWPLSMKKLHIASRCQGLWGGKRWMTTMSQVGEGPGGGGARAATAELTELALSARGAGRGRRVLGTVRLASPATP